MNNKITPQLLAEKAWEFYQNHGVPIEVSQDIISSKGLTFDSKHLEKLMQEHQNLSRDKSGSQFKSGLLCDSHKTRRLHTVTHILHSVLREMYGPETKQMGSAITDKKARFDFTYNSAITQDELIIIEKKVQDIIDKDLIMEFSQMPYQQAKELNAIGLFGEKYGDLVKIYSLRDDQGKVYSREFCTGPHISKSKEIGKFKIIKQKSVGQGIRRLEFNVE